MTEETAATLRIRRYETRDYEQVWALHREGVLQTTPQYPQAMATYEDDLRNIESTYLAPGSCFWVAEAERGLIAMAAVQRIDAETGRLRRMRATAAWRRRGIAQRLLETAEAFCRDEGYRRLVLDTTEHQAAAQRLYERNSFIRHGERRLGDFMVFDYEKALR